MVHRPALPIDYDSKPAKGLSDKTRTTIGVSALILCLLIGGGIVYWLLFGASPKKRTITVDPSQQTADPNFRAQMNTARRRTAVVKEDDNKWVVRGSTGAMFVRKEGAGYTLDLFHPNRDFMTPDQIALVSGFVRAKRDEAMAKEWGISADQITRLKAIDLGTSTMSVSDKELGELRQLWDDYQKAADGQPKNDAEKKLVARLDELGKNNIEASRKAFAQRLEQIKKVLTPEQIQKIAAR